MKNKLSKILGVALTVALVSSLFVFAAPVSAQAYTPNQWNTMSIPGALGQVIRAANVTDFAVASDGTTIYAIDAQTAAPGAILKSTNGGKTWAVLTSPITAPATVALVAVAPDNPSVMAVVDTTALDRVWFSSNGGATWADLGDLSGAGGAAAENITDIKISPARAEALLGRDIVVCTVDTGGGAFGDVYLVGTTATWTNITAAAAIGLGATYDYTSVAFEPNWLGGRAIVAVGCTAAAGGTFFQVIRTSPLALGIVINVQMAVAGSVLPSEGTITSSSLALPSDFDSTSPPATQAYVGFNSAIPATNPDVYRQDFNQTRKLNVAAAVGIQSISFIGTRAGGTLFAGFSATADVWYSANPQTALPTWSFTYKAPTGASNTVVQMAPDFDTSKTVYAGTTGAESGFSRSTNGGVSYNQLSLIDTTLTALEDVMPAPDNSVVFMATSGGGNASLWKTSTPPAVGTWERVRLRAALTGYIIRLSPDYLTDATIYYCDVGVTDIQRSTDGGDVFSTRTAAAALTDLAVESQDIVYMASGTSVYKSTNGAWFFGLPIPSQTPAVFSLAMAPSYPEKPKAGNVLVGGTGGAVSLSTDSGASFIPLLSAVATGNMQVGADKDYATNNLIYAASSTAGQGIYRYEFGVSTAWEQIRPVAGTMSGLATQGGTLYGSWTAFAGAVPGVTGDAFTLTAVGVVPNTGTITVLSGSVTAAITNAADTIGGVAGPRTITIAAGVGAVPYSIAAVGSTVVVTAASANSGGTWAITAGGATASAITTDTDTDAYIVGGGGAWGLPDAAVVAVGGVAASGAERSLSPTIPDIVGGTFTTMDIGVPATATFASAPSALRAAGTATDVWLWTIDTTGVALMAYDDTMAKAVLTVNVPATVPNDPSSGRNAAFNITWDKPSNALIYNVGVYLDAGCSQATIVANPAYVPAFPLAPALNVAPGQLSGGTKYYVRVFVVNQVPGDGIDSPRNPAAIKVVSFTVEAGTIVEMPAVGPTLLSPTPGDMNVPLRPGFSWSTMPNAEKYEIIVATDSALTQTIGGTPVEVTSPNFQLDADLAYSTTYFYAVKVTAPTASPQSIGSFTTMAKPVPPVEPPDIVVPPAEMITPGWIWAIIIIGAILVIAVIVLIVTTRRVP